MPYGYYQLVRYITAFSFIWFALKANESKENDKVILFIAVAILFQPLIKIPLGRTIWNVIDVILAGYLVYDIRNSR